jgi:hypothetical protein
MLRRVLALCSLALLMPLASFANEFDWLVREFCRESGAHQTHIPFFGLVRFGVAVAHPAGTSELRLAVFEKTNLPSDRFSQLTDSVVGGEWKPMIRVRSRNGESTNIYVQETRKGLRLLITSLDGQDATFVQVRIKPDELIKFVDDHHVSQGVHVRPK